jgi:uncharacterized membrane protein
MRSCGVLVLFSGVVSAAAGQSITNLGPVTPYAVSGNGQVACGVSGQTAFRWTSGTGVQGLPQLTGHTVSYAIAASLNGAALAGYSQVDFSSAPRAVIWSGGVVTDIGTLSTGGSAANDVSADGLVVVGASGELPFRWTSGSGMQSLGLLQGWNAATASTVNSNGSIIAGVANTASGRKLFRWTPGGGHEELAPLAGNGPSAAGVSENGQIIAGVSGVSVYRWTQSGGLQDLGLLPGYQRMTVTDMTPDGSVIIGYGAIQSFPLFINEAFVWTQGTGIIALDDFLTANGVATTGWELRFGFGISTDGRTLVGLGTHQNQEVGWIASLPSGSCYANCDGSTAQPILNVADFTCFLQRFAAGCR